MGVPNARADSFSASFDCTQSGGGNGCSGIYVPSAPDTTFSTTTNTDDLVVTWDSFTFDFTAGTLGSPTDQYDWSATDHGSIQSLEGIPAPAGGGPVMTITDLTLGVTYGETGVNPHGGIAIGALPAGTIVQTDSGTITFTDDTVTNTPEPASASLMLMGIGFLGFVMRKRLPLGNLQAS